MRTVLNPAADPLLGRLLDGRYEICGRLAQGGMAVVYTAFDIRLDRAVAVKVMHPALAADEDFVSRFRREAKAAARLSSPHVVAVTDQGRDGDVVFLVMELVEGRTLREVLREAGRLPAVEALQFMIPVLEALATAHRGGLVHRDVKPENVLVADDGTVKVGDFGLARAVDASPLTATAGLLLGTVAYLAPEQVARGVADARADVYACGVMLFELLTGRPPFEGTSALQVAYQHLNDEVPPPSSLVHDVPPAVDRLVAAATARDPADRPHDATALLFRSRAVLERLVAASREGSWLAPGRRDTAPLGLELAEAAALELARSGKPASSRWTAPEARSGAPPEVEPGSGDRLRSRPEALTGDLAGDPPGETLDPPASTAASTAAGGAGAGRKRRLPRPSRLAALLVILATVAAGLIGWRLAGRTVAVPAVVGSSPAAAEAALRDEHLSPRLLAVPVYSEAVPKGKIASVDPPVGHHASRGAAVSLAVSLGPERYTVPTVTGLRLVDADAALRVAHLHPNTPSGAYSDTVPAGSVISITPTAGSQAQPQAPVAIVASRGPAPVTAPKLTGMTGNAAAAALRKLHLKVTVSNDFSDSVPIGQVIAITPATGLHRTQTVSVRVSKGPKLVQIPGDIENRSPGIAKQYLSSLGLNVVTRSFPGLDSSIAKVLPGPGSLVRVGSQVTLLLY